MAMTNPAAKPRKKREPTAAVTPWVEAWEQQPGETDTAFAAFAAYLSNRSYARAARAVKVPVEKVEGFAREHAWERRATAYDVERERERRMATIAELDEMATRQASIGVTIQQNGMTRIEQMTEVEKARLPLWLALRMVDQGVRIERLARGVGDQQAPNVSVSVTQENVQYGTAAPIAQFLRDNPDKVGPVVELLQRLQHVTRTETVEGTATEVAADE